MAEEVIQLGELLLLPPNRHWQQQGHAYFTAIKCGMQTKLYLKEVAARFWLMDLKDTLSNFEGTQE